MSDKLSYRVVSTKFRGISPSGKAIFVDKAPTHGRGECTIPRSLIHGADDIRLHGKFVGEEITFRLVDWKAEELGFA